MRDDPLSYQVSLLELYSTVRIAWERGALVVELSHDPRSTIITVSRYVHWSFLFVYAQALRLMRNELICAVRSLQERDRNQHEARPRMFTPKDFQIMLYAAFPNATLPILMTSILQTTSD